MKQLEQNINTHKFLSSLFFSGVSFCLSFYFCILGVPLYIYSLPIYAFLLLISLFLFYQTDKHLNDFMKEGITTFTQYQFYHLCVGVYLILSFVLFGVSVAYLPFYYNGGLVFVWYCAPMSLLCFISFIQSKKRINVLKKKFQYDNLDNNLEKKE
ncbi:hypothetical protein [Neobacillus massiliamazoniensis]|jgi:hypothetical protein|uniref:Uncharacterized protein n=1 Tax=Neobacillus massiliamazoniensis TaxID=1499688 RepID=A0A0U1NY84_9BACI|nr:hypothetical protein [Neobacillus massiliamazoniensis]CRK82984.1 hypothetical protein BN000_02939 [Neobacillus massiliamazoniensis]